MPKNSNTPNTFQIRANQYPAWTQIPNVVLDYLMAELKPSVFAVYLFLCRRTFGFHKECDQISLNQIVNGIKTKDGRVLCKGTGLTKKTVIKSLKVLKNEGLLIKQLMQSEEKGYEATRYTLIIPEYNQYGERLPLSQNDTGGWCKNSTRGSVKSILGGGVKNTPALVENLHLQKKQQQKKQIQKKENKNNNRASDENFEKKPTEAETLKLDADDVVVTSILDWMGFDDILQRDESLRLSLENLLAWAYWIKLEGEKLEEKGSNPVGIARSNWRRGKQARAELVELASAWLQMSDEEKVELLDEAEYAAPIYSMNLPEEFVYKIQTEVFQQLWKVTQGQVAPTLLMPALNPEASC
jgi:hypothetical protein